MRSLQKFKSEPKIVRYKSERYKQDAYELYYKYIIAFVLGTVCFGFGAATGALILLILGGALYFGSTIAFIQFKYSRLMLEIRYNFEGERLRREEDKHLGGYEKYGRI